MFLFIMCCYFFFSLQSWKLGFSAPFLKANQLPALFQWFLKLKGAFVSKFSLYFFSTLGQQASFVDFRQLCSKLTHDYYHKYVCASFKGIYLYFLSMIFAILFLFKEIYWYLLNCRINIFQRRYDASAVVLVFDATNLEDYQGPGYHHPNKPLERPTDLDCYPIVFSHPIVSGICIQLFSLYCNICKYCLFVR